MKNYPFFAYYGLYRILFFLTLFGWQPLNAKSLVDDNRTYVEPVRSDNPFRSLSQSAGNLQEPQTQGDEQDFDIGAIKFNLTGSFSTEFNDNVNSSETAKLADIILRPGINLEGSWPVTKINTLRFNIGMNYTEYVRRPDLSEAGNFINITPDTQLRFVVVIDPLTITFSDQFSYLNDPTDAIGFNALTGQTETNVARYNRYTNLAGVNIDWRMDQDLLLGLGLSRFDLWTEGGRFKFRERTEYSELLFIKYLMEPTFVVGLSAQTSQNRYKQDVQQDADTYSIAPTIDWTISRRLSTFLSAGWFTARNKPNSTTPTSSSSSGVNGEVSLRHLLTRFYSHSLGYTFRTSLGDASNTTRTDGVRYGWEWAALKKITLTGSLSFDKTKDTGGIAPEKFDRVSGDIGFKYTLSKKLSSSVRYSYINKNSKNENRSFVVNKLLVSFFYDF